jgi:transposase
MGTKSLVLNVAMHRVRCHDCAAYLMEQLPFVPAQKVRYSKALARTVIELRSEMSILALARHFGLHWETVKQIEKAHLARKYRTIRLRDVKVIGIDEIHVGDQGFMTIVRDLDSGAVLHVGQGKGGKGLKGFLKRLRRSKCKIEAVAMDMAAGYTAWVREKLPRATIVYDHFHLIKLMNEKVDKVRRRTVKELEEEQGKALKKKRWLFIKGQEKLDEDGKQELDRLCRTYEHLGTASMMKETLRNVYKLAGDKDEARLALNDWCKQADASQVPELRSMARTIRRHVDGILGYWTKHLTSAAMEGFNNKIRWLIRQAYGYGDQQYFTLKIFDLPNLRTTTREL